MKAIQKTIHLARLMRYWREFNKEPRRVLCIKDFGLSNGKVYIHTLLKLGLVEPVPLYISTGRKHKAKVMHIGYTLKKPSSSLNEKQKKLKGGRRTKEWKQWKQ
jgi:hypothetical protein